MTLEALQYLVTDLALKHNLVNCAISGPSIYAINPEDIKEYPLIFISPTGTHTIKENTTRYSLTFFYMDRLLESSANEESINSAGIETLRNLKLQLSKIEVVTDMQEDADIRLFTETERMADRVAGAYMTIWIETLNPSTCPAFFDDYGFYIGNYFATEGLEAVLDNLASKEWVNRLIAGLSISGITPEEFERIMGDYVLRRNFATINGNTITNRERFNLVEQAEYNEQVRALLQAISDATGDITTINNNLTAVTQEIRNIENNYTSVTQEIQEITNNYTAVTENITVLSADTTGIENRISELSASTDQEIEKIYRAISAATPDDYGRVKTQVSANTRDIATLSGATYEIEGQANENAIDILNISAATLGVTEEIQALSAQTTTNTAQISAHTGQISDISDRLGGLSGATSTLSGKVSENTQKIADLSGFTHESVSSLTHDIETLSQAISGYTPQGYGALQTQVSANTSAITEIQGDITALQSAVTNIDDYCFFANGYSTPWDVRNSDDLVDYVLSLGDDFAKARIFIPTQRNPKRWREYQAYSVSGNTVYVASVFNDGSQIIKASYGTYTKGVSPQSGDFEEFSFSNNLNIIVSTLQTQVAAAINDIARKQDKLTAGRGIEINSENNTISADVASSDVHNIVGLTQSEYDALATKDPDTLYIIKPLY